MNAAATDAPQDGRLMESDGVRPLQKVEDELRVGAVDSQTAATEEQTVDAIQVSRDDDCRLRHVVGLAVKEADDGSRLVARVSEHGDCQKVLLSDGTKKGDSKLCRLPSGTPNGDLDCRREQGVEHQDEPAEGLLR